MIKQVETKKAMKLSDLEVGAKYIVKEEITPVMVYEGIIDGKYAFIHKLDIAGPILSWRNEGELKFSEDGEIILGESSNFEIYFLDSQIYKEKIKLIEK